MTFSADEARLAKILPGARCKMQPGPRTVQIAVAMPTSQDKSDHPPAPTQAVRRRRTLVMAD